MPKTDYCIGVFRNEGIGLVLNAVNTYISYQGEAQPPQQGPPPPPISFDTGIGTISTDTLFTLSLFTNHTQIWTTANPANPAAPKSKLNTHIMITTNSATLSNNVAGIGTFVTKMADMLPTGTHHAENYVHELHIEVDCPGDGGNVEQALTDIRGVINDIITADAGGDAAAAVPVLLYKNTTDIKDMVPVNLILGGKSQSSKRKNRKRMMRKSQKNKK
jgi:hypothetical protein